MGARTCYRGGGGREGEDLEELRDLHGDFLVVVCDCVGLEGHVVVFRYYILIDICRYYCTSQYRTEA